MKTVAAICILSASVASVQVQLLDAKEKAMEHYRAMKWNSITSLSSRGGEKVPHEEVPFEHDPSDSFIRDFE